MNKASGDDITTAELFKILKVYAVKVLHSIGQKIWKTQLWPQNWKRSVFNTTQIQLQYNSKKGNAKECSYYHTAGLNPHTSKIMLKILQARFQ